MYKRCWVNEPITIGYTKKVLIFFYFVYIICDGLFTTNGNLNWIFTWQPKSYVFWLLVYIVIDLLYYAIYSESFENKIEDSWISDSHILRRLMESYDDGQKRDTVPDIPKVIPSKSRVFRRKPRHFS